MLLVAYGLAAIAGYVGATIHLPLAWMLGALVTTACLSLAGADLKQDHRLRRLAQLIIGSAVGLSMTGPALLELARWFPLMIFAALFSVLASTVASVLLARLAHLDRTTAFFASLPGGLAEMENIGPRMGADPEPIAIVHTLRVALVVLTVPPVLLALGRPDYGPPVPDDITSVLSVTVLLGGGAVFSYLVSLTRLNNPFMIGAVVFATFFAAQNLIHGRMPPLLFSLAQLLIGFSVGCRFRRDILTKLPRLTFVAILLILGLIGVLSCFGLALSLVTELGFAAAILATSPGGLSEMAATAQALHLALPAVVAFQVLRGMLVNGLASHYFVFFTRFGVLTFLERLLGRNGGS